MNPTPVFYNENLVMKKAEPEKQSAGLKIPKESAEKAALSADSEVIVKHEDQKVVICRTKKVQRLNELLAKVTKDNCHPEIFCDRAGKEIW